MAASQTLRLGIFKWPLDSDEFTRVQMDTSHANLEARAGGFYYGATNPTSAEQYERSLFYNTTNQQLYFFNGTDASGAWIPLNDFIDSSRNINIGNGTATTINKVTITAPASSAILTVKNLKEVVFNNSVTFSGTDSATVNVGTGGTVAYLANKLNAFATTTSSELLSVLSDPTGTGSAVFATSPTLVTPNLGIATAVSVNKLAITAPATSATISIANGSTFATAGSFTLTLTATAATNVTLPTTGTLSTVAGIETLTNKSLSDTTSFVINAADTSKRLRFDVSGVTTATTRVLTVPNVNGTIVTTGDTGTVSNTMISAVDYTKVTGLQTWSDGRYYTETEINNAYLYQWGNRPTGAGGALTNARQIYVQADAPTSAQDGDLWFDL